MARTSKAMNRPLSQYLGISDPFIALDLDHAASEFLRVNEPSMEETLVNAAFGGGKSQPEKKVDYV